MGVFLDAAFKVLDEAKRPLSAKEIVLIAIERGLLVTTGSTPSQTMKSKLATDILENRDRSLFMRSGAGLFTLRSQRQQISEHIAPRFKKSLFDEEIVVFKAELLHKFISKVGISKDGIDTRTLLFECFPMQRRIAEDCFDVIQLVSLYVVKFEKQILTYKRSKRLPESRLHGSYSIGFGGHLNPDDIPSLFNFANPSEALTFILRELREELLLPDSPEINFQGLLYDDSRDISRQHLGLVYSVDLSSPEFDIGERGFLTDAKFESLEQILGRLEDFENWSVMIARNEAESQ